jgi:hypothetical protein
VAEAHSARWNVKRGLIRLWVLFAAIWLTIAGGMWVSIYSNELAQLSRQLVASVTPAVEYEALCARLRAQRAAGGPVDQITALPTLDLVVTKGVAQIVASHGDCLMTFAKEEGVDLVPTVFKTVGGDGSKPAWIKDMQGGVRPNNFQEVPRVEQPASDLTSMLGSLAIILGVPAILFVLGSGVWWAVMGFRSDQPRARSQLSK